MDNKKTFSLLSVLGQITLYGMFALFIGIFSQWPPYQALAPEQAMIKLSFNHHGKPISECHKSTEAELLKLPPNMRAPIHCPRERSPVKVELSIDGVINYQKIALPAGLSKDGASSVYHRLQVPSGTHRILVRLNDDSRKSEFIYSREETVDLKPAQILVIDFDSSKGGITFQ